MDSSIILGIIGAATGAGGLLLAVHANRISKKANSLAETANETARESLDTAMEANRISETANKLAEDANFNPDFAVKFLNFIITEVIRHHEQARDEG